MLNVSHAETFQHAKFDGATVGRTLPHEAQVDEHCDSRGAQGCRPSADDEIADSPAAPRAE